MYFNIFLDHTNSEYVGFKCLSRFGLAWDLTNISYNLLASCDNFFLHKFFLYKFNTIYLKRKGEKGNINIDTSDMSIVLDNKPFL